MSMSRKISSVAVEAAGLPGVMPSNANVCKITCRAAPRHAQAKRAGPALTAAGGRFLARGMPSMAYEVGLMERAVLIEFDSVEQATAAHDILAYQAALAALGDAADRDIRIIEGFRAQMNQKSPKKYNTPIFKVWATL